MLLRVRTKAVAAAAAVSVDTIFKMTPRISPAESLSLSPLPPRHLSAASRRVNNVHGLLYDIPEGTDDGRRRRGRRSGTTGSPRVLLSITQLRDQIIVRRRVTYI